MSITLIARDPTGDVDEFELSGARWRMLEDVLDALDCDTSAMTSAVVRARTTHQWAAALTRGLGLGLIFSIERLDRLAPSGYRTDLFIDEDAEEDEDVEYDEVQFEWLTALGAFFEHCGGFDRC